MSEIEDNGYMSASSEGSEQGDRRRRSSSNRDDYPDSDKRRQSRSPPPPSSPHDNNNNNDNTNVPSRDRSRSRSRSPRDNNNRAAGRSRSPASRSRSPPRRGEEPDSRRGDYRDNDRRRRGRRDRGDRGDRRDRRDRDRREDNLDSNPEPHKTLVARYLPRKIGNGELGDVLRRLEGFVDFRRRPNEPTFFVDFNSIENARRALDYLSRFKFAPRHDYMKVSYDLPRTVRERESSPRKRKYEETRDYDESDSRRERDDHNTSSEPRRTRRRSRSPSPRGGADSSDSRRGLLTPPPPQAEPSQRKSDSGSGSSSKIVPAADIKKHDDTREAHELVRRLLEQNEETAAPSRSDRDRDRLRVKDSDRRPPRRSPDRSRRSPPPPPMRDHLPPPPPPIPPIIPQLKPGMIAPGRFPETPYTRTKPFSSFADFAQRYGIQVTNRPTTLYMYDLPPDILVREIENMFRLALPFDDVTGIRLERNKYSKYIAFVDFRDYNAAVMAISKLNDFEMEKDLPVVKIDFDLREKRVLGL